MKNPRYLTEGDRMVYLAEYNVRQGAPLAGLPNRVSQLELTEEDPVPAPGPEAGAPAAPEAAPAPAPEAPAPEAAAAAPDTKVEILAQVAHAQREEMTNVLGKVDEILAKVVELEQNTLSRQRASDDRLNAVSDQVRRLTPPSPLEQMQNMIKISGGQSIDDYFNEWAQKNGDPTRVGPGNMYQAAENPEGEGSKYYVNVDQVPSLSADQAKRSLGL